MTLFDANDRIISYETADYGDMGKDYTYRIFDGNGNQISEKIAYCNINKSADQYNDN